MPSSAGSRDVVVKLRTAGQPSALNIAAVSTATHPFGAMMPNAVVSALKGRPASALFTRQASALEAAFIAPATAQGIGESPAPLATHLDRSRFVRVEARSLADAKRLVRRLELLSEVESAYVQPIPHLPLFGSIDMGTGPAAPPGGTPDFRGRQMCLEDAPRGLGIRSAWSSFPAAMGRGVTAADVECGWVVDHEDFGINRPRHEFGELATTMFEMQHGTASVGQAISTHDTRGVVGMAPDVDRVFCASILGKGNSPENAIDHAAHMLQPGDVLLIELDAPGPVEVEEVFLPMEFWEAVYTAVLNATERGIIVVAAAGNGALNLDDARLNRAFDRTHRDSGAILVGAGAAPDGVFTDCSRLDFSNYGSRLDVQGYGGFVCSTGLGDLQGPIDGMVQQWYTGEFSGTSSAAAMVWAACILLQSIARHQGGQLSPVEMRSLLARTGTPQVDEPGERPASQRIGPRPDLQRAIAELL